MQILALTVKWMNLGIFRESHKCEGDDLVSPLWRAIHGAAFLASNTRE
jgi:hypothetical protein